MELLDRRTAMYTPEVTATPRILDGEINFLVSAVSSTVEGQLHPDRAVMRTREFAELLVIDEADRLKTAAWRSSATATTAATSA